MPTYNYECSRCGQEAEKLFLSIQAEDPPVCQHCSFIMTKIFKGSDIAKRDRVNGKIFPIDGLTLEHLPGGPRTFDSYRDMKNHAKDNGLQLGAIL